MRTIRARAPRCLSRTLTDAHSDHVLDRGSASICLRETAPAAVRASWYRMAAFAEVRPESCRTGPGHIKPPVGCAPIPDLHTGQ